MSPSSNERTARETIIPGEPRNVSRFRPAESREDMAILERRVFRDCAAGSFRPAPVRAAKLRSQERAAFIYFIDTVCFCLPALPPA